MTLAAGSRLGPYEVLAAIGAGGMGEVYRAKDTRLEREVAIKVLPPHLSSSEEMRQRFEREARAISQLSHPHICALYDVGSHEGTEYLVMELLEGETLAARLVKGPLPTEQLLRFGVEIADALDKAHRQGIVHRDLKPGNVMLTKSGVKLLDFGLAKALPSPSGRGQGEGLTSLPTAMGSPNLTQEGTILGTFQYRAPEQLEGKDADARTDIFAFGATLYEMATGNKAFSGTSQASLISAIMKEEPAPISTVQPTTPPALDRVIRKCLAKDPEDRWQNAADLGSELKWIGEGSQAGAAAPLAARGGRRGLSFVTGIAVGVLTAGAGVWTVVRSRPAAVRPLERFSILLPADAPLRLYGPQSLAVSADGTRVVYVAERGGTTQLYVRVMDQLEAVPIRGTEGATSPFFSPDSQWVGFCASEKLQKVSIEGGTPQAICEAAEFRGGTWGADDTIVFGGGGSGLRLVRASGGTPKVLTSPDSKKGEVGHWWPEILPGGDNVLFQIPGAGAGTLESNIALLSLKTGKSRPLLEGSNPRYVASGHVLFLRGNTLLAAPFDLSRLEFTGPAVTMLDGVLRIDPISGSLFGPSGRGALVYAPQFLTRHALVWVDRHGAVSTLPAEPRNYEEPRVSPDGQRIAVTIRRGLSSDIWVYDAPKGALTRLTFGSIEEETPIWSPDSKRVAFSSARSQQERAVCSKAADGGGQEELLFTAQHPHLGSWSSDGKTIAFTNYGPDMAGDLAAAVVGSKGGSSSFLRTRFNEHAPKMSPDGRWLAYVSNESGRDEVYVQAFPGPGGKWQISSDGGSEPVWSRDARELFFRNGDKMLVVQTATQPSFSAASPQLLFQGRFVPTRRGEAAYDVAPDGQRFLMVR
ncbi:MAG: protein kinase domain-containing protein, partial [Thermoanaerobaculia bacterium]